MPEDFKRTSTSVPTVTVKGIVGLLAYARSRGVDVSALLAEVGVAADVLEKPDGRLLRSQTAQLWELTQDRLDDPTIAIKVAELIPFGSMPVVDYMIATSQTVRDAIEHLIGYYRLIHDGVEFRLDIAGDVAVVSHRIWNDRSGMERYSVEIIFAALTDRLRELCDAEWNPVEVRFAHETRADVAEYERRFGAPVVFGVGRCELVLPGWLLDAPMKKADPVLNSVLRRHAKELMDRLPSGTSVIDDVRQVLCEIVPTGDSSIATVASRLGVSTRTLQRRLKDDGAAFHEIVDQIRLDFALRFLADPEMAIGEVGFVLGFSEPSAFTRAFRRWTGQTPGELRRRGPGGTGSK